MTMRGEDLLTIDSVEVDDIAGDGNIYGEIMIEFHGTETVYRQSIGNAETKLAGDFLSLTGKPYGRLTDWWTVYVSLYDGDDLHDVAVGEFAHDIARAVDVVYNKPMRQTLHGQYGAVTINYSIISGSVTTRIEAVLIDEEEENGSARAARVYGTIRACTYLGKGEDEWTEMTLFGKSAGESVAVLPGGAIPMDRRIVAVPDWSNISIAVELRLAGDGIGAGDDLIALGSVEFDKDDGQSHAIGEIIGDGEEGTTGCGGRGVRVSIHIPSGHSLLE